MVTILIRKQTRRHGTRVGPLTSPLRSRLQGSHSLTASMTSSSHPSVFQMLHCACLLVTSTACIKGVGTIVAGRVEQGTLHPGDVVCFVPAGLNNKKVFSIEEHHKGDSIGISIKGLGKDEHVSPGDIMYLEKEGIHAPVKEFTALVQVCSVIVIDRIRCSRNQRYLFCLYH